MAAIRKRKVVQCFKSYHSKAFKQTVYFEKLPSEEQIVFNALANV